MSGKTRTACRRERLFFGAAGDIRLPGSTLAAFSIASVRSWSQPLIVGSHRAKPGAALSYCFLASSRSIAWLPRSQ